jgi:long-chain acyl-CoA synthetase
VRFDLSITEARRINARGALAIVDFAHAAHQRGRLQRLGYISTAFVGGSYPDRFGEDDLDVGQRFRNSYEQSKFEAELVMHAHMRNLPITVLRPSIIVGHSQSGATSAFNVIYWPLRVFADGMLRYAPAPSSLPVDVVPVDFVARGIIEALFDGEAGSTYALAAGDAATSAGAIGDIAARVFDVSPPRFVSGPWQRVLLPALNPILRLGPWRHFGKAARQYLPYFGQGSRFDTRHADALLRPRGVEPPPAAQVLVPVLEFAKSTDFGRNREAIATRERALRLHRRRALTRASTRRQRPRRPVSVG